ncbi:MAG: porin family protein [Bacteroidota bacterium]
MNCKRCILFFCFSFICITICDAQRSRNTKLGKRFSAGLMGGFVMSQIDGDNYTGFDRRTVFGGLKVSARILDNLSFEVNLLFVRKGASIENEEIEFRVNYQKNRLIHLQYTEVPLLLNVRPKGIDSKLYFEGGVAFSRLLNTRIEENVREFTDVSFAEIEPEIQSTDISLIAGMGSYLTKNVSLGIRFSYGINKIYTNDNPILRETAYQILPTQVFFMRNYYISANVAFNIF